MNVTISEKRDNPLLQRRAVEGSISFEGATPSNTDIAQAIAKDMNAGSELVVVKHIYTRFSHQEAKFDAVVYKSVEALQKMEMLTKDMKKKAEAKKAEEKKADAVKAEEKKAEEATKTEEAEKETPKGAPKNPEAPETKTEAAEATKEQPGESRSKEMAETETPEAKEAEA
jgi:ribosomal protein S24E